MIDEFSSEVAQKLDPEILKYLKEVLDNQNLDNVGQKDLPEVIKALEEYMKVIPYWQSNDPDVKMFKDHLKGHKKNFYDVSKLKDTTEELYVRCWDNDDVGRNLFFSNHVGCCVSVQYSNGFAACQHLMNSFVKGIEIVDKGGNSMGNSVCYFAKVDGKLTFVIDSFEATGKLGSAPEVTDALIEYARQVCAEMGRPDADVMFGPNYNKLSKHRFVKKEGHTVEIIGRVPDETYIDAIGGHADVNSVAANRPMFEIIDIEE